MVPQLLVNLPGHGLDPFHEQGIIDMGSIISLAEIFLHHGAGPHASVLDLLDRSPIGLNLVEDFLGCVIRHIDFASHPCSSRIGSNGSPGIAGRVQGNLFNAHMVDFIDEPSGAAVLKGARWLGAFQLKQEIQLAGLEFHQRGHNLPQGNLIHILLTRIFVKTEHAATLALVAMAVDGIFLFALFAEKIHIKHLPPPALCF